MHNVLNNGIGGLISTKIVFLCRSTICLTGSLPYRTNTVFEVPAVAVW